ncbi:HAMP domain-containing sensor histidine kinase [uncultured Corynebacterium sp.]|uniref:HAMP domain-containing sensor histidine kinase n=1 Tax=uncultured Corynebacterium sp. TaxID=159447 RepID=UPI00259A63EE|nr:HAMP domain-containing sensor histidine kinase [uncultured Corynebacterium sp.]
MTEGPASNPTPDPQGSGYSHALKQDEAIDKTTPEAENGSIFSLRSWSLRMRLAALTAAVVIVSIVVITLAAFTSVSQILYLEIDKNLQNQAQNIIDSGVEFPAEHSYEDGRYVPNFQETSNRMNVLVIPAAETGIKQPGSGTSDSTQSNDADSENSSSLEPVTPGIQGTQGLSTFTADPDSPVDHEFDNEEVFEGVLSPVQMAVVSGEQSFSFSTEGSMRIYAVRAPDSRVVVVHQDIEFSKEALNSLRIVLILIGVTGALAAIIAGMAVGSAGVQPIDRLRRAANRVAETGELRQIPVESNDELGSLTRTYNAMMRALQVSTEKQRDLVADAGHELKTPLTSLRTNIELLVMASRADNPALSEQDRADLERDVIAQINEMSTLIGDLVDLAREDSMPLTTAEVDLEEVFADSLERVERRRPDVHFDVHLVPWVVVGDEFSLSRAIRNLLDNAAKWSPQGGTVRVWMEPISDANSDTPTAVEIRIADSGPGIPEEDRAKVFERFYRSIQSRSMPGSGLGLAIVKQVILRHNGAIIADASDDGGALMRVVLPGKSGSPLDIN